MKRELPWGKCLSGKWIFTVITASVFGYTAVNGILSPEAVEKIITMVGMFYFLKKTGDGGEENGKQ